MSPYGQRSPLIDAFMQKNQEINLSALRTPEDIYQKHILDSSELAHLVRAADYAGPDPQQWRRALDVGTGWWFPLLPLAHLLPDITRYGIDARRKKIRAVEEIAHRCGYTNVHLIWWRIEEHPDRYDLLTARAVTLSDTLIPWLYPRLTPRGCIVLYKMFTDEEDMLIRHLLASAPWKHKLRLVLRHTYTLPDSDIPRILYILQDIALQKHRR